MKFWMLLVALLCYTPTIFALGLHSDNSDPNLYLNPHYQEAPEKLSLEIIKQTPQIKHQYNLRFQATDKMIRDYYTMERKAALLDESCKDQHTHYQFILTNYGDLSPEQQTGFRKLLSDIRRLCGSPHSAQVETRPTIQNQKREIVR